MISSWKFYLLCCMCAKPTYLIMVFKYGIIACKQLAALYTENLHVDKHKHRNVAKCYGSRTCYQLPAVEGDSTIYTIYP